MPNRPWCASPSPFSPRWSWRRRPLPRRRSWSGSPTRPARARRSRRSETTSSAQTKKPGRGRSDRPGPEPCGGAGRVPAAGMSATRSRTAFAGALPRRRRTTPSYGVQWALPAISALAGWNLFPGSYSAAPGATVGIVDTGVEATHSDLAANMTSNGATCVGGCAPGNPTDIEGHGTHVAGIAAAAANNSAGDRGSLVFVAHRRGARVPGRSRQRRDRDRRRRRRRRSSGRPSTARASINLSLGAPGYSQTMCNAISTAINTYHVVVVAAAGNSSTSVQTYPASCPGTIGVAATDSTDHAASFSNYGAPNVFVSAPGVGIRSTYPPNTYTDMYGTSMASPYVTGLAALLARRAPHRLRRCDPPDPRQDVRQDRAVSPTAATRSSRAPAARGTRTTATAGSTSRPRWPPRFRHLRLLLRPHRPRLPRLRPLRSPTRRRPRFMSSRRRVGAESS